MQKQFISLLTLSLIVAAPSFGASPQEEERIITAVKKAFEKKDATSLIALCCWDGVTDQFKQGRLREMETSVLNSPPITSIRMVPPNPKDPTEITLAGTVYRMNVPITAGVEIKFADEGRNKNLTITLPVGERNGTLCFPNPAPIK